MSDEEEKPLKVRNPKLSFRLPREDDYDYAYDDKPTLLETAFAVLGPRLQETKKGFILDGRLVNLDKVIQTANLRYKDDKS